MKTLAAVIAIAAFLGVGVPAIADDSSPQNAQAMKDCMAKQKAMNSTMTQAAMETVCKNEAKGQKHKDGNDLATAPQAPEPQK